MLRACGGMRDGISKQTLRGLCGVCVSFLQLDEVQSLGAATLIRAYLAYHALSCSVWLHTRLLCAG